LKTAVIWIPYLQKAYKNNKHSRQEDLKDLYNMKIDWEESRCDVMKEVIQQAMLLISVS
jgi:hypothetical protein